MLVRTLKRISKFLAEEDGPTSIEYMVMISVIVIVCLITINAIGQFTLSSLSNTSASISSAVGK
ncbi:MAG: Flp family type IVb pilin [Planctomycetota bacterium]|nr:Flp family type IVb pilin [Planctomycetota bacterium]